jgi:acyl carrier protein
MTVQESIKLRVRKFIEDNYLFGEDSTSLEDADSLIEAGLIDSTGILELLGFLELEFGVQILDEEVVPDNFDSIVTITSYVSAKRAGGIEAFSQTNEAKLDSLNR